MVWQVKVAGDLAQNFPNLTLNNCAGFRLPEVRALLGTGKRGMLKAQALRPVDDTDPCITDPCITLPEARYRGQENHLCRVEIHQGGEVSKASFKCSRENGSVLAKWVDTEGNRLTVSGVHDGVHGFKAGDWVELPDDPHELRGEPGVMVRLSKVGGDQLTLDLSTASGTVPTNPDKTAKIRRWEQKEGADRPLVGGAVPVQESTDGSVWVHLENGIQIQFQPSPQGDNQAKHVYRTGDYWLIPARTATGDIEWPGEPENPQTLPPQGIEHHHAPLAVVVGAAAPTDLRKSFAGLAGC